jgi:hypothetical protein
MPMRRKERDQATTAYRFALDPEKNNFCDVRILSERGHVLDYTVIYLTIIEGRLLPVERFDAAHGYPHRDALDWDGHVVEKQWMPLESLGDALDDAILDVKMNYQRYFDEFQARRSAR